MCRYKHGYDVEHRVSVGSMPLLSVCANVVGQAKLSLAVREVEFNSKDV